MVLTQTEASEIDRCGNLWLTSYQKLARLCDGEGVRNYRFRVKLRYLCHAVTDAATTRWNPKIQQNSLEEDLMGRLCKT
eukprot:15206692-Alexandrium_andersonii.AAC.1